MENRIPFESGQVEPTQEHIAEFLQRYVHPDLWQQAGIELLTWQMINLSIVSLFQQERFGATLSSVAELLERLEKEPPTRTPADVPPPGETGE